RDPPSSEVSADLGCGAPRAAVGDDEHGELIANPRRPRVLVVAPDAGVQGANDRSARQRELRSEASNCHVHPQGSRTVARFYHAASLFCPTTWRSPAGHAAEQSEAACAVGCTALLGSLCTITFVAPCRVDNCSISGGNQVVHEAKGLPGRRC